MYFGSVFCVILVGTLIFRVLQNLSVGCDIFLQLSELLFQLLLLLRDESSKKLLFETILCDSKVNNCGLCCEFGREMRVSKT